MSTRFMKAYDHVYLSPHYDDAALSCGGAIHRQTRAGEAVLVVTVCAAAPDPDAPRSPVAEAVHAAMGNPDDLVAARLAEDDAALWILGADALRLDFQDAIYRGRPQAGAWFYTSLQAVFGAVHPEDEALRGHITDALNARVLRGAQTMFYAPLGVGGHVDHQLAHAAAWAMHAQGWRVVFYEDYPYADAAYAHPAGSGHGSGLETVLAARPAGSLLPRLMLLSEDDLRAKIDSVRAYRSQVPMLFGSDAAMASRICTYALLRGGNQPAERLWAPAPAR